MEKLDYTKDAKINSKMNYEISFYRILFTLFICLHHFNNTFNLNLFTHGFIGVEFFFVLSGFFIYKSFDKDKNKNPFCYMKKRIIRLYPEYLLAALIAIIGFSTIQNNFSFEKAISEILMLQNSGIFTGGYNYPCWYISVLMVDSFIIYGLMAINKNFCIKILFPLIIFGGYTFIFAKYGTLETWDIYNFLYVPLLRGLCALSIGVIVAYLSKNKIFNKQNKLINNIFSITARLLCLGLIFYDIFEGINNQFITILAFAILIYIVAIDKGICAKLFNFKFIDNLGKISYSMYLNHAFIILILSTYFNQFSNKYLYIFIYLGIAILFSIFAYILVNFIVKLFKSQKSKVVKITAQDDR